MHHKLPNLHCPKDNVPHRGVGGSDLQQRVVHNDNNIWSRECKRLVWQLLLLCSLQITPEAGHRTCQGPHLKSWQEVRSSGDAAV
jgi:hypothetical protein